MKDKPMYGWKQDSFDRQQARRVAPPSDGVLDCGTSGILAGTKVATSMGWRPVEAIAAGDQVLTFDGGLKPVKSVRRHVFWTEAEVDAVESWPLFVPAGALGNSDPVSILPGQAMLIESDLAEDLWGDPFALVPAMALDGYRGIAHTRPAERIEVVELEFDGEEIVFGNMGALFHCNTGGDLLDAAFADPGAGYRVLSVDDADALVTALEAEEMAFAPHPAHA